MHEAVDPAMRAVMTSDRLRRWIPGAERVATVGRDFEPARVGSDHVIRDRDHGEAVALVRRESLVEPAGGEAALDGALAHLKRIGALVPNREIGEITRQKRIAGTKKKLRVDRLAILTPSEERVARGDLTPARSQNRT